MTEKPDHRIGALAVKSAMPLSDSVVSAPLTDEEIAHYVLLVGMALGEHGRPADVEAGRRLIAELTRLRSDAWLVAAARELSVTTIDGRPMGIGSHAEAALAILRKYRDGKA